MKKNLISMLAALALVTTIAIQPVNAKPITNENQKTKAVTSIGSNSHNSIVDTTNGLQLLLFGNLSESVKPNAINVMTYLKEKLADFNFKSLLNGFYPVKIDKDDIGYTHIKFQQTYAGKIVYGKTITAHFNEKGLLQSITGTLENRINSIIKQNKSSISTSEAIEIAKASKNATELTQDTNVKNYIYYKDGNAYDVYKVTIAYEEPELGSYDIFVDAFSGNIVAEENRIKVATVNGTGYAVNGDYRTFKMNQSGSKYYMENTSKKVKTYTYKNSTWYAQRLYYNTNAIGNSDPASVSAHSYGEVVYDFYKNVFNRNSLDNNGMTILSKVHYGKNYNNAFWDGSCMTYGDGDGSTFTYFSGDLDVVAHEMSHGVTSNEGNMNYEAQPGALNETVSDVLGVCCQTYDKYNVENGGTWQFNAADWVVGDEIYTPNTPGDALRSLANPTLYNQPAHMDNYYTGSSDNYGVHTNSGITNKAAYIMAQQLGCEKVARIWYRALCTYFNTTTNFAQAKAGLVQAAKDLYGTNSNEASVTSSAFSSVGIN